MTPPPAKEVFKFRAKTIDPNTLGLEWQIKPGFFLYQERFHLSKMDDEAFTIGDIHFPKPVKKTDSQNKIIKIYRDQLTIPVAILGHEAGEDILEVCYQGCSDDGFCYPPKTMQVKLTFNENKALIDASTITKRQIPTLTEMSSNHSQLKQLFSTQNWALIFLCFFGFGLLLSFTPCVLPMIPVLSGIIIGQKNPLSTKKAFFLSLSYVLSMATTYAIIGATVALIGSNLQILLQSSWSISIFSFIFILLSLSMFNFYHLQMPASWQAKLTKISHSRAGGYYLGAAIMGCLSTLILSPCVTAPLIGALGYIAKTGDVVRGSIALFFLGMGMGTPLLIIGTSAGKYLPKAGHWMNIVKAIFGILLLAVAIELLSRIFSPVIIMCLWASLLIFSGIYAGAFLRGTTNQEKFCQGIGIISLVYGILILVGASQGNQDPLQPLVKTISAPITNQATIQAKSTFTTLSEVQHALEQAKQNEIPVILDFYANWCTSCKYIDSTTLKDPEVIAALNHHIVFLKVDITDNNSNSRALLSYFNVVAPPTFIFFNSRGSEKTNLTLVGEISSKMLINTINQLMASAQND